MRKFIFGILLTIGFALVAQDSVRVLTLEECIDMAVSRNLTVKQNQNNLFGAQSNKKQAYFNFLPNLNANLNHSYSDGSDIIAGDVIAFTSWNARPNISSNLTVFNAFANHHLLNRRKHEFEASRYQLENSKLTIKATVIRNYLNVLVDTENVRISDQRLEFLEEQLEREKKRVSVGVGNLETVYNFQSQVANEKLNNVNLKNQYQSDLLSLLQSIQIESYQGVRLQPLDVEDLDILIDYDDYDQVLNEILSYSFMLKSAEESELAAQSQLKQARSGRYPTLSLFGQHARNYTSQNDIDYTEQIKDTPTNFAQLTLQVPIFNRYQTQNNIDNTKVTMMNAQLQADQAMLDVTNAAQRDYLDLVSAQTSYQTAQENYEALNQTFEFIKKRFETGNTDFYSYLESLNNKNRAEAQLINAKYTIVLRKRILDLYRGK
ncbi:TolC family protein [Ekhidna sp. MALMAid0563]|uniref:TolC family protein n=1 Tax=Ekhidna sp. MALMAid0563 TaxID=3143937 RepID=UPI0032DF8FB7